MSDIHRFCPPPCRPVARRAWREGAGFVAGTRIIAEETPVAFSYGGCAYAVMMGTPDDLEDFAIGFSLSEQVIDRLDDIEDIAIAATRDGIAVNLTLAAPLMDRYWERRRFLAGPSGCGLCGIESLEQALRRCRPIARDTRIDADDVTAALAALAPHQALHRSTRAVHAAGLWQRERGLALLREDIGRHNALDKLIGAAASAGLDGGDGLLLLTSRISVELVQKACVLGSSILIAVSAPTGLALRVAEEAGLTIVAIARRDGFEVFTHPERIIDGRTVDLREEAAVVASA
jgi:FdhD protein